jgi:hypothetical protein
MPEKSKDAHRGRRQLSGPNRHQLKDIEAVIDAFSEGYS